MKRIATFFAFVLTVLTNPCHALELLNATNLDEAHFYKIAVLQVANIEPYQDSYRGFIKTLKDNGIEEGKNLSITRTVIDFDLEKGGFWSRIGVLLRIRDEAARIAESRPDLVLTIGTPATRFARGPLSDVNIPVVFTAVAIPEAAGCDSMDSGGPGVTGATLYMDMADSMKIVKQIFPQNKLIGMIHTDDENGVAHIVEATRNAKGVGMEVLSKEVKKQDNIAPAANQLYADGVRLFAVPLDVYYGLRQFEPAKDLSDFGIAHEIPVISFALAKMPGAVLYTGADFGIVGSLSGKQAVKILQKHVKPEVLPILKQSAPTVLLDPERLQGLKIDLPKEMIDKKQLRPDGLWQVVMEN